MTRIFITGASGFLGQAVLDTLRTRSDLHLKLLLRRPDSIIDLPANAEIVSGDLLEPAHYRQALEGCDIVLHMAAMTGKAAPDVYHKLNSDSTVSLLKAAKEARVSNFLFVSTIASTYAQQKYYPYAQSKAAAEASVRASGLAYTILRPTIIMGDGSPIADTLGKIASAPIIPLPQSRAPVFVQPVHVRDVATGIARLIEQQSQGNEDLDLGGPDALSFRDFLARLHMVKHDKEPGFVTLPLAPIQWGLALLEPFARNIMPATAGQLSVFGNSSTANDNWLMDELRPTMIGLVDMLPQPPSESPPKSNTSLAALDEETRRGLKDEAKLFSIYLANTDPDAMIIDTYIEGATQLDMIHDLSQFETATLAFARRGILALTITDAYCGFFNRGGALRRRLIVMLAILEKAPLTSAHFQRTPNQGPLKAGIDLILAGLKGGVALIAGLIVCLPLALFSRRRS